MNLLPVGLDFAPGKGEINRASWSLNATREADCPQESLEAIMYLSDRITFLTCGVAVVAGLGPQRQERFEVWCAGCVRALRRESLHMTVGEAGGYSV